MGALQEVFENRDFLKEFTLQQLRTKYRGSVLGYLWAILVPLVLFATMAFVFSIINNLNAGSFAPYFFGGYIPWLLFVNSGSGATMSIVGNRHLLAHIRTPKATFPVSVLLINLVELLGFLAATLVIMLALRSNFSPAMLFLPVAIVIVSVFVLGVSFLFATINVFVRDFMFVWTAFSTLWFFCTPIIFPLSQLNPIYRKYFELNPILPFIQLFQDPISKGLLPSAETIVLSLIYAVILFIFGATVFTRSQKSFYPYL
jgi:lipopolysaccharide transport system permease protein